MRLLSAVLALLLPASAPLSARCISDPRLSLDDMIRNAQPWFADTPHNFQELQAIVARSHPWSNKVPRDFKIDQRRVRFSVSTLIGPADVYWLPSAELGPRNIGFGIGSSWRTYQDVAECRVQAPDGRWWLVLGGKEDGLSYVPEDQTEAARAGPSTRSGVRRPGY